MGKPIKGPSAQRDSQSLIQKVPADMPQTVRCVTAPDNDDLAQVRSFAYKVKVACDDLHGDPFDQDSRKALLSLLVDESQAADAARARL